MDESGVVYGLRCLCHYDRGYRYVGKTVCKLRKRFSEHMCAARREAPDLPVHRWMVKHGLDNIVAEVIDRSDDPDVLTQKEIHHIKRLGLYADPKGLNLTFGGEGVNAVGLNIGSKNGRAKLNEAIVAAVKGQLWDGVSTRVVAKDFGIALHSIDQIAGGGTWKSVPWPADRPRVMIDHKRLASQKLTEDQVREIKSRLQKGEQGRMLGREFGVTESNISMIKSGRTWAHVVV